MESESNAEEQKNEASSSERGAMAFQIHTAVNELMGGPLKNMEAVINAFGSLNAVSATQIQDMYDKLRVVDLESARPATAHFHMVKGAEGPGGLDTMQNIKAFHLKCLSTQPGEQLGLCHHQLRVM